MPSKPKRKLAAIMFTDMVGYTALMQEDEDKARELIERHRDLMKPHVDKHGGEIIQYVGDGTFCRFDSAKEAVNAALEIQHVFQLEDDMSLRIGIHVGDVVVKGDEVYGDGVNVASRLEPLAEAGGICISHQVYENIKNQSGLVLNSLGKKDLKNVDEEMEVFMVTKSSEPAPVVADTKKPSPASSKISMKWIVVAAVVTILVIVGLKFDFGTQEVSSGNESDKKSIAVLPFENMSSDLENEYFSDGMTEEIINALTKINGLRVASRTSSFRFKGEKVDIREVGKKLNVETILEGSVRKSGANLRITAQLINVEDGFHIWSETFERELSDVFAIQDEISRSIVNRLKIEFAGKDEHSIPERHTENMEAYNLYLKGRFHCLKSTKSDVTRGIEYLDLALSKDSSYALAYVELSNCYSTIGYFHNDLMPIKEAYQNAFDAAENALRIDDNLAGAHTILAYIKRTYYWDWEGADRAFKRSIELKDKYPDTYYIYALYLAAVGRFDEAVDQAKNAVKLDPVSRPNNHTLARIYYYSRQYEKAIDQANILLEMDPGFTGGHSVIANVYEQQGRYDEAIKRYVSSGTLTGSNTEAFWESHQTFEIKDWENYWKKVLEWVESYSKPEQISSIIRAVLYTRLDRKDDAIKQLELAYEKREGELVYLNVDPKFDSLRSDKRFKDIILKMGLVP